MKNKPQKFYKQLGYKPSCPICENKVFASKLKKNTAAVEGFGTVHQCPNCRTAIDFRRTFFTNRFLLKHEKEAIFQ